MTQMRYAAAITDALRTEMAADDAVLVMGEDVAVAGGVFGVTRGLLERFGPQRVIDTPISEHSLVGAAVGAAMIGARPVVEIMFSDFVTLAMDGIVNQAAKMRYMTGGQLSVPIVVRLVAGSAGATAEQHSQCLEAWFAHVPGLKVVAPSTPGDARGLMLAAIRDPDPVIFVEHKALYNVRDDVDEGGGAIPLGTAVVRRRGSDVTVVSYLKTVHAASDAAVHLAEEGIDVEVLDSRSLVPFDRPALRRSLEKTGRLVVAHEAPVRSGFGAEIAAIAASEHFDLLRGPVGRVGAPNTPVPYAPELEAAVIPDAERISSAVRWVLARSSDREGAVSA